MIKRHCFEDTSSLGFGHDGSWAQVHQIIQICAILSEIQSAIYFIMNTTLAGELNWELIPSAKNVCYLQWFYA
jgi:predicted ABC-type ATPase